MPRYRALLEYDGTSYYGFQRQREGVPTIQGELEKALAVITSEAISITGAGRTDTGVHASGQVVSFQINWQHSLEKLQRAINVNLPRDIAVMQIEETTHFFHPRFSAKSRSYEYFIYNTAVPSPLRRLYSWHVRNPLDMAKMNEAAQALVGVQNFATFGQPPQGENTVREVLQANWQEKDHFFVFYICANAFLYRMVRSIVGSLKAVGDGSWTVSDFVEALKACDRNRSAEAAPAHGLHLVSVTYAD